MKDCASNIRDIYDEATKELTELAYENKLALPRSEYANLTLLQREELVKRAIEFKVLIYFTAATKFQGDRAPRANTVRQLDERLIKLKAA